MATDIRLKKEKDFNLVFNKGKRLYSSALSMVFVPSETLKAGFAVSKKHGGSVQRNRIKRLLREVIRLKIKNNSLLDAQKLRSMIFIAKPPSLNLDYKSTEKAVTELLERIK